MVLLLLLSPLFLLYWLPFILACCFGCKRKGFHFICNLLCIGAPVIGWIYTMLSVIAGIAEVRAERAVAETPVISEAQRAEWRAMARAASSNPQPEPEPTPIYYNGVVYHAHHHIHEVRPAPAGATIDGRLA